MCEFGYRSACESRMMRQQYGIDGDEQCINGKYIWAGGRKKMDHSNVCLLFQVYTT